MLWTLLLLFLVFQPTRDYYDVPVEFVYDGDTFFTILPCAKSNRCKESIRVKGIDTPEIEGHCSGEKAKALQARNYLRAFLSGKQVDLDSCERDIYNRLACRVYADDKDVAQVLIEEGLGRYYEGRSPRRSWCP